MRPGYCISKFECNASKHLLFQHTCSITELIGDFTADKIHAFVREHVKPHESHYCFHLRRLVRHFSLHTNCGHEGENNGLKHCTGRVMPQHSLNNAVCALTWQAERGSQENNARICVELLGNKIWSSSKHSEKVLVKSGSMFSKQWDEHKNYQPIKVKSYQWLHAL